MTYPLKYAFVAATLTAAVFGSTAAQAQCASDQECKGGRVCEQGVCTEPTRSCAIDVDCPGDLICNAGACTDRSDASAASATAPPPPPASYGAPPPPVYPATFATTGPGPSERPGDAVRYETERKGITGLIIAGPITFGVAYVTGIAVTAGLEADGDLIGFSAVPIAGPWMMLADQRTGDYAGALVANGLLQAGGIAMFVVGLSVRTERQVPVYASDDGSVKVGVSAIPTNGGAALSAGGHF